MRPSSHAGKDLIFGAIDLLLAYLRSCRVEKIEFFDSQGACYVVLFKVAGDSGDESAALGFKQLSLSEGFSRATETSGNEAASSENFGHR